MPTSDIIVWICLCGAVLAAIAALNFHVAHFRAKMTPQEREQFDKEVDDDMSW